MKQSNYDRQEGRKSIYRDILGDPLYEGDMCYPTCDGVTPEKPSRIQMLDGEVVMISLDGKVTLRVTDFPDVAPSIKRDTINTV